MEDRPWFYHLNRNTLTYRWSYVCLSFYVCFPRENLPLLGFTLCFMSLNSWSLNHHPLSLKLFIFGCAGSLLLYGLFSCCGKQGLLSSCGVWASDCSGFSCRAAWAHGLQQLQPPGSRATQKLWCTGLATLRHAGLPRPGMSPCLLHWQAESLPHSHQGGPTASLLTYHSRASF